jgi:hypothetical protein
MNTSYFQFVFTIYFISIDTITRKQHHINRSVDDDPFQTVIEMKQIRQFKKILENEGNFDIQCILNK